MASPPASFVPPDDELPPLLQAAATRAIAAAPQPAIIVMRARGPGSGAARRGWPGYRPAYGR